MATTLSERPATGIAPPARPSVWSVGWATFVGYFLTVLFGLPIALVLGYVGIDLVGDGAGRGLFARYDAWSWAAEACAGLLATFVTAWVVSDSIRHRTGWEVPFSFAFLTLLLTGYAPLLALTPLYGATAPVSLAAATLILRWRAEPAGAEPHKLLGAVPRRYRRFVAIGLAVAGPLMFAYVLAYGATHPLQWSNTYSRTGLVHDHHPGQLNRFDISLENAGAVAVTDMSIVRVEGTPALQLERAGIEAKRWTIPEGRAFAPPPMTPLDDYRLSPQRGPSDPVTLVLRQGHLCPPGVSRLDAVWVRYTVLGMRHEQRIPLEQAPGVRCP